MNSEFSHVILSEAKDSPEEDRASQEEILRFAQDDMETLEMTLRGRVELTPVRRCLLVMIAALPIAVPAAAQEAALIERVAVGAGESIEIRIGPIDQIVNLDPELVRVEQRGAEHVVIEGLRLGHATLRLASPAGTTLLRIEITTPRQQIGSARSPEGEPALRIEQELRYHAYDGGVFGEATGIPAQTLALHFLHESFSGSAAAWMEHRDGDLEVPHFRLQLERALPNGWQGEVEAGTSDLRWEGGTFPYQRFAGASVRVQRPMADGRRGLNLQMFGGEVRAPLIEVGSQFAPVALRDPARLGGAHIVIDSSPRLALRMEGGLREESDGELRTVAGAGLSWKAPSLGLELSGAHDGERGAGEMSFRWNRPSSSLRLTGQHSEIGFRSLQASSLSSSFGYSSASGNLTHRFDQRWSSSLSASWRRRETLGASEEEASDCEESPLDICDAVVDSWGARLATTLRASRRSRVVGWIDQRDEGSFELGRTRRGGGFTSQQGWRLPGGARFSSSAGWEWQEVAPAMSESFAWHAAVAGGDLGIGRHIQLNAEVERRWRLDAATPDLEPWLWQGRASWKLRGWRFIESSELRLAYRSWEDVGFGDRGLIGGRFLSGGLLISGPLSDGADWKLEGSWDHNLESGRPSARLAAGVRMRHQFGRSIVRSGEGSRLIRRQVDGIVYLDENGNGLRDDSEPGLGGIVLRLADGRTTTSDAAGRFGFRIAEGSDAIVRVEPPTERRDLAPTAGSFRTVDFSVPRPLVEIGLGPSPVTLEIVAFNDLDGNGVWDEREPLVPEVVLRLPDGAVRTVARNPVRRPTLIGAPGAEWEWSTIPSGYQPGAWEMPRGIDEPGSIVKWHLPLIAMRSVRGHLFLDANGNGRRDVGESVLAGAIVASGSRRAVSDAQGSFTLKGLPSGGVSLTVLDPPAGWTFVAPVEVELPEAPATIDGIQLALQRAVWGHPLAGIVKGRHLGSTIGFRRRFR